LNAFFTRRIGAVIVLGPSHRQIFDGMIAKQRIHTVANFAQDCLFLADDRVDAKWSRQRPLKLLYLGGMISGKGYLILLEAFLALPPEKRDRLELEFAGGFESDEERKQFEARIAAIKNVRYHGIVDGTEKRQLFEQAHIFCLPSMFFEGQPLSILEAYASGCVVLASNRPGILDIFDPAKNGFLVEAGSPESIRTAIELALTQQERLPGIARNNRETAGRLYTVPIYASGVTSVLKAIANVQ
jgi:glycosyltransferase involved in cell wall biosynthesis